MYYYLTAILQGFYKGIEMRFQTTGGQFVTAATRTAAAAMAARMNEPSTVEILVGAAAAVLALWLLTVVIFSIGT